MEEIIEIEAEDTEQEISVEEDIIIVQPNLQEKSVTPKKVIQEVNPDEGYNGLSKVIVEPYEAITGELTATSNGTYKAVEQGLDGFDIVNVETAGINPSDAYNLEIAPTTSGNSQWEKIIKAIPVPITITNGILGGLFYGYPRTAEIPIINSPNNKIYNAGNAFRYATLNEKNIKNIESLDFSECTDFSYMFSDAKGPYPPHGIDCSSAKNLNQMFMGCNFSGEIILKNTQNVQSIAQMAQECYHLEGIGEMDCSSVTAVGNIVKSSSKITHLGGFVNLGKAYSKGTSTVARNYCLDLSNCMNLTRESAVNVIKGLYDIKSMGIANQYVKFWGDVKDQLTSEEIKTANDKGWDITK